MDRNTEDKLSALFAEFRDLSPDPEVSAGFMPGLWQRIEARRSASLTIFRRFAQVCVAATVALTVLMGLVLIPHLEKTPVNSTYADALVADHPNTYVDIFAGEIK